MVLDYGNAVGRLPFSLFYYNFEPRFFLPMYSLLLSDLENIQIAVS
jgi:hypothetical protein